MTSLPWLLPRPSSSPTTPRSCATASRPPSLGAGHTPLPSRARPSCWRACAAISIRIDLIVLDLRLPHSGGVDIVRAIRKLDGGRLPILVFSGTIAAADEVRELAALGVSGYINEYSAVQHILPSLAPHLYPDNFNRRGSPRVILGIPIAYRFGNTIAAALTLNLSKGGVAIRTMSPLEQRIEAQGRASGCPDRSATSKRNREWPGAIGGSGWDCSSRRWRRPIRRRSISSSISTSSATGRRSVLAHRTTPSTTAARSRSRRARRPYRREPPSRAWRTRRSP